MKKICAIEPYNSDGYKNRIFEINYMFRLIKDILEDKGYSVCTFDYLNNDDQVDLILLFSYNKDVLMQMEKYSCIKIYFASEPEVVVGAHSPHNLRKLSKYFSAIYTQFDNCIDEKSIFKMNIPENLEESPDMIPFDMKKLVCNVSGFKSSKHPKELYSLRRRVIDYFRDNDDFDFYGYGDWKSLGYSNFRGEAGSKMEIYHKYKFALCCENACNIKGYITEKIIDCFRAGIVPIYYGERDTRQYIPDDCYIHLENYLDDMGLLEKSLNSMDEATWNEYVKRGKEVLHNECENVYSFETFRKTFEDVAEHVENMKCVEASFVRKMSLKLTMSVIGFKQKIFNIY